MVDGIIQELNATQARQIIKFTLNKISTTPEVNTLQSIIEENGRKKRYAGDVFKVANLVKISYTINFDFDKIVEQAYNWVK